MMRIPAPPSSTAIMDTTVVGAVVHSNGSSSSGSSSNTAFRVSPPNGFELPAHSATTEALIQKVRAKSSTLNPNATHFAPANTGTAQLPGFEEMRRSVLENMKTTINMDAASTPPAAKKIKVSKARATPAVATPTPSNGNISRKIPSTKKKGKASQKRKRSKDESESAEESDAMSGLAGDNSDSDSTGGSIAQAPIQTLSGRNVVKPTQFTPTFAEGPSRRKGSQKFKRMGRNTENAVCKRCGRGHSPASNMIVFCDGCNLCWHQMCHDPMIKDDIVKDETKEWFCHDCYIKKKLVKPFLPAATAIATIFPSTGPSIQRPEPDRNLIWDAKGLEEKRNYLDALPRTHLISLLLQACQDYPDIIFDLSDTAVAGSLQDQPQFPNQSNASRRTNVYPQQPFPPSATSGLFARAEANPSAPINFIRRLQSEARSASPPFTVQPSSDFQNSTIKVIQQPPTVAEKDLPEEEADSRESTPDSPPYPRPGNGLMSKLKPDDQDLEWLVGEGESEIAFSQMMSDGHGGMKRV